MNKLDWSAVASLLLVSLLYVNCSQAEQSSRTPMSAYLSPFSSRSIGVQAREFAAVGGQVSPAWRSGGTTFAAGGLGLETRATGSASHGGATKMSGWKQFGICGSELLAGCAGSLIPLALGAYFGYGALGTGDSKFFWASAGSYVVGNALLTSSCVACVGHHYSQKGAWWGASAGATVAAIIGYEAAWVLQTRPALAVGTALVLPAIGAVVGYNLTGGHRE